MEFNETWQEARSQHLLPSLCVSGWSENQDGCPGLWLAETFSTFPLKLMKGIQRNLTGSKISMSSTDFVFFGLIGKTRWWPSPLIGCDIFDFSSETAERNSTKLDRKQDLNIPYPVGVFQANRKNMMAALASDLLRHFLLLLWNCWTEFKETWQEARSQCPLPSLYFSGWSVIKNGCSGWFLIKVAHCTQVHDMWPFGPLVYVFMMLINKLSWQWNDYLNTWITGLHTKQLQIRMLHFYTPVFRQDVLWYGDVRPSGSPSVRLSVRPSVRLSVRVSIRPFSALFSYMLWHTCIELKFCTWLCFNVLQIKFECRQFPSIFEGVMPLCELRICM